MPNVPKLVGKTVGACKTMPVFALGVFRLSFIPPYAPDSQKVTDQSPAPDTMLDIGGVVTAMVSTQSRQINR